MCFSAPVSFAAAAVLGAAGVVTVARVRRPADLPLATSPLVFAAQQAIEGALWLTVPEGRDQGSFWANLFVFIALTVWPLLIPIAMALAEPDPRRRFPMLVVLPAGIGVAIDYAGTMLAHPYRAWPAGWTLTYVNNHRISLVLLALYVLCVCTPPLLSSSAALRRFGLIVIAGLALSALAFYESFISVWCFFAALASLSLLRFFFPRTRPRPT
jgi:hypothetical protein